MQRFSSSARDLTATIAAAVAGFALAAAAVGQSAPQRTVRDGIFSAQQVIRGERSFERVCMDCHEMEEFTGVGAYLEKSDGKTVWQVFEYIWSEMPEDRPAWLEPNEYADILAYMFSVYGLPAGDAPMPITRPELRQIRMVRPEMPGS